MAEGIIRLLIVDRIDLFREGLAGLLSRYDDIQLVGQLCCGEAAVQRAGMLRPDVILMDCALPGIGAAESTRNIRNDYPHAAIAILTASESEDDLFAAVRAGARGYLLKSVTLDDLHSAIADLASGGSVIAPLLATRLLEEFARVIVPALKPPPEINLLTAREREVLELLTQGKNNREIAERLALADSTVKVHIRNIVGKLPVKNRHHAAAFAVGNASATPYSPDSRSSAVSKGPDRSNGAAYSRRHPLLPVAGR